MFIPWNILSWYNGYTIGGVTIINTWSFLSYMVHGKFLSYWIDTTFTASVKSVLEPHMQQMFLLTFQLLFSPESVPVPAFSSLQTRLQESLTAYPFVLANLREDMRRILYSSISYIDAILENSYHCFFFWVASKVLLMGCMVSV